MALRVRLAPRAVRDLEEIRAYLLERSPQGADRVRREIDRTIRTLAEFPEVGHDSDLRGIRALATIRYPYLIYHVVRGGELVVVHIRHGARDAPTADSLDG